MSRVFKVAQRSQSYDDEGKDLQDIRGGRAVAKRASDLLPFNFEREEKSDDSLGGNFRIDNLLKNGRPHTAVNGTLKLARTLFVL
jgi:hypothetical protein